MRVGVLNTLGKQSLTKQIILMERRLHTRKMFGRIQAWAFFLHTNVAFPHHQATRGHTGTQIPAERELTGMIMKLGLGREAVTLYMQFGHVVHISTVIIIETQVGQPLQPRKQGIMALHSICMTKVIFRNILHMVGRWTVGQQLLLQQQVVIARDKAVLPPPHQRSVITQFLGERFI